MLQIVKIKIGRAEFRERLKPLGLQESGDATNLRVTSTSKSVRRQIPLLASRPQARAD